MRRADCEVVFLEWCSARATVTVKAEPREMRLIRSPRSVFRACEATLP
jgi:hypothetical protein